MRRAAAFLTALGGAAPADAAAVAWFPAVGALAGLAVGLVWWAADGLSSPAVAAAVAVAADLAVTGLLHVDGLADTADGLLPPLPRDRRLEAMADPAVGAFGVAVTGTVLLLRFASLASMRPDPLAVAALWAASRAAMGVALSRCTHARPEGGLASAFTGAPVGPVAAGGVAAAALGLGAAGLAGLAGVVAVGLAAAGVLALAGRRIGGFTGDVLGAAGVVGETAGLLVLAGSW